MSKKRPGREASGSFDRVVGLLVGEIEFLPCKRGEIYQTDEGCGLLWVPEQAEEIKDLAVQVIVNFDPHTGLAQQDAGGAAEDFNVGFMLGEMTNDPRRDAPFSAVIAQRWAGADGEWQIGGHLRFGSG